MTSKCQNMLSTAMKSLKKEIGIKEIIEITDFYSENIKG